MEAKFKHFQPREVRFDKYKHKFSPWISSGIIHSIKYRDSLYRKLKKTDVQTPEYSELSNNLRIYNSILKKNIRLAKSEYYTKKFDEYKFNIRRTWSTINDVLNKNKNRDSFPNFFMINGNKTNSKQEIASSFNSFFANIGKHLSNKIHCDTPNTINTYMKQKIISSFEFQCIDGTAVHKIISDLSDKNSCGVDDISSKLLKTISPVIAAPLAHIINQSLCTGIFPDRLKIAKVIPLYKKDDPHMVDNYRPISLLPVLSKVFERAAFNQLYDYMQRNKLLYANQYGFRKLHSTELASVELVDRIRLDIDSGKIPLSVFLDLSKAFDTLDHSILLQKIKFYGVSGTSLQWFTSYLVNRQQLVDVAGTHSTLINLTTGVPQGSILGPLLFIIHMNDIYEASKSFHAILYADDTSLYSSLGSFNVNLTGNNSDKHTLSIKINNELINIQEWLNINKLSLNVNKTKYMIFHNYHRDIKSCIPDVRINNQSIERVSEFNFLGLTIDEHLNWNAHIQKISNKIAKSIGIINRLKRYLPLSILRTLYNALVLPHFQFSILNWGFKANKIVRLQKRAIRVITNSKYNAHVEPLLKKLNLLKISDIFRNSLLKLYYKYKSGNLPHYVMHMFSTESNVHRYNTRSNAILNHPVTNLFGSEKCVRYHLPRLVEETDSNILEKVDSHCYTGFSIYLRKICVQSYKSECNQPNCYTYQNVPRWYEIWMLYVFFFLFALLCIYYLSHPFSLYSFLILFLFSFMLFLCSFTVLVPLSLLYLAIRTYKQIFGLFIYSALPISRGHFSPNNSRSTPIARSLGRDMDVILEPAFM